MTAGRVTEVGTVVIGGGQAGLAVGYHLRRRRPGEFVILDAGTEVGATWRQRWDSLRLFTPAGFTHLPGMAFPAARASLPTKDAMADYLADYARTFALPIETAVRVEAVRRDGSDFLVAAAGSRRWSARDVVIATGAHATPVFPAFAGGLDPAIVQLHSRDYRRSSQLPAGAVLVVGAGNSGAEIAVDLAADRPVWLAGRDVGHVPPLGGWTYPLMKLLGRPAAALAQRRLGGRAEPLGRIRPGDLAAAGVRRLPRVVGIRDGTPLLADGRMVEVSAVVWCTGLRPDHGFVHLPVRDSDGRLAHRRGVVTGQPGLYVVGLPNQSSITSHLVGGIGADARYVVDHLHHRAARDRQGAPAKDQVSGEVSR